MTPVVFVVLLLAGCAAPFSPPQGAIAGYAPAYPPYGDLESQRANAWGYGDGWK